MWDIPCIKPFPVFAQEDGSNGQVTLESIDTKNFPQVDFYFRIFNSEGRSIKDLSAADISVLENGLSPVVTQLQNLQPGSHIVIAYDESNVLATAIAGSSIDELIRLHLVNWARSQPTDSPHLLSLIGNRGLQAIRLSGPDQWVETLQTYSPDLSSPQAGLDSISRAIDLATDPNPHPDQQRMILYITSLPGNDVLQAIPNLAARAAQENVPVFVWLVGPQGVSEYPTASALNEMSAITGGQVISFSGVESLPDIGDYLEPMGTLYQGSYRSLIRSGKSQNLSVIVQRDELQITSNALQFDLAIQPPNPMFLSPPDTITRVWNEPAVSTQHSRFSPTEQIIQLLFEFPDGHPRPFISSQLFVDGKLVAENTREPFDRFTWKLESYESAGWHLLQAFVEDSQGLQASTIELPVEVQIDFPLQARFIENVSQQRLQTGAIALSTTIVLGMITVVLVRRRKIVHSSKTTDSNPALSNGPSVNAEKVAEPEAILNHVKVSVFPNKTAPAQFIQLDTSLVPIPGLGFGVDEDVLTIGRDPELSKCILDYPEIEPLHAKMVRRSEQQYQLSDCGSLAGTYINYSPVGETGIELCHGDLVHFGRIAFLFTIEDPPCRRTLVVTTNKEINL